MSTLNSAIADQHAAKIPSAPAPATPCLVKKNSTANPGPPSASDSNDPSPVLTATTTLTPGRSVSLTYRAVLAKPAVPSPSDAKLNNKLAPKAKTNASSRSMATSAVTAALQPARVEKAPVGGADDRKKQKKLRKKGTNSGMEVQGRWPGEQPERIPSPPPPNVDMTKLSDDALTSTIEYLADLHPGSQDLVVDVLPDVYERLETILRTAGVDKAVSELRIQFMLLGVGVAQRMVEENYAGSDNTQLDATRAHETIMAPLNDLILERKEWDQLKFEKLFREMLAYAIQIVSCWRTNTSLQGITQGHTSFLFDVIGVLAYVNTRTQQVPPPPVFEGWEETKESGPPPPPVRPQQHEGKEALEKLAEIQALLASFHAFTEESPSVVDVIRSLLSPRDTANARAEALEDKLVAVKDEHEGASMGEEAARKALLDEVHKLKHERNTLLADLKMSTERQRTLHRDNTSLQQQLQASKDREAAIRGKLDAAIKREQGLRGEVREFKGQLRARDAELAQARVKITRLMQQGGGGEAVDGVINNTGSDCAALGGVNGGVGGGGGRRARRRRGAARAAGGAGVDGGVPAGAGEAGEEQQQRVKVPRVPASPPTRLPWYVSTYVCMRRAVVGAWTWGVVRPLAFVFGRMFRSNLVVGGEASRGGESAKSAAHGGDGVRGA